MDRYAEAVLDGGILAGPYVRLACERHFRDRERAEGGGWFQFSEAFADQILDFYEGVLRLPDLVDELGDPQPFRLDVGTGFWAFVLGSGFGWVDKQRLRRFREWFIETGKGSAKALALDTPIPTVHGWKAMGDIVPGDVLFDERGQRTTVLGAYDVMHGHDCYRVTFDDGSSIVADAEHLWFTEKRNASDASDRGAALRGVKLRERGAWKKGIRTTAEIAATLRYRNGQYQSANHSIPVAGALDCLDVVLPIEPYTLGVWLGDGDSDCARVTVGTEDRDEMVGLLQATGTTCGTPKPTQTAWRVRVGGKGHPGPNIDSLNARLRLAGLFHNKHVPAAYLRASARQRLALLQGLMDTDGTIDKRNGQCSFTTTRRVLADGVRELAASLGMKATTRTSAAAIRGRRVGDAYHVAFFPPPGLMVFRLARKAAYQFQRHQRRRLSGDHRIVSCERVPSVPVRCIAVDSPSKLFLAGPSMVPTHNTPVLAGVGLYGLTSDGERAAEIYAAAADQDQAGIMFRDAVRIAKASPDLDEVLEYDGGSHIWQIRHPESLSFFKTFSRESGQKSGTRPHMGLLDELHEHPSHDTSVKVRAGAKRRPQPLFAEITNSGFDRTSICWQRHEHARRVVEQTVDDDRLFAYVCALDDGSSEHVGTSKRAVQIVLNSCTCHSVPTTMIDQLAAEGYAALATHAGMPPRAPSDAPNTLIGQCAPLESALPAITDSVRTTASMRSESEPRSSDGSQSMRIDSPPTSEIGSQSAQAIGSEWPRSRNSEHTASTRRDSTSLLLPSEASARAAEESHGSSPSTTTTLLADLEDCCASPAIRESVFSAILSKVYNAHSTTCAVRQQATISGDSVRYKYSADDPMVDPTCWPKTNPYLGVTVTEDYLRRQVENAKNIPAEMNGVLRLNFCVWTQSNERFFDAAKWQVGAVMPSDAELAAATCYAGIDAGQSDDISAFARLWVLDDGRVAVKMRYWLPQAALDKYPERPYAQWKASGLLTVTEGDVVDYEAIEQTVEDLCRESGVLQCGFDKRFLGQMSQRLAGAGLSMVDIPQGFHLNEAIKRVSEWVAGGELCHGGDPILAWMADNAVVKFGRNKEMRLDKEASKDKIDGIAALVIAARLVTLQEVEGPSVYESRGALVM